MLPTSSLPPLPVHFRLTSRRLARHSVFWAIILLWTTAVYEHTTALRIYLPYLGLNLLRLPLIVLTVYGIVYGLVPQLLLRGRQRAFALAAAGLLLGFTLADRAVIGSGLSGFMTASTGLTYTFFSPIPILRNSFLFLAILSLFTAVKFRRRLLVRPVASAGEADDFLHLSAHRGEVRLRTAGINYLAKAGNNVHVHCGAERYVVRATLKELLGRLPDSFVRNHRSFVVNRLRITVLYARKLQLEDGTELPVSRGARTRVRGKEGGGKKG